MPFVNSYTFAGAAHFGKIIPAPADPTASGSVENHALAIGADERDGGSALAAHIGPDGSVAWAKTYNVPEFVDGVLTGDSGFVLLSGPRPVPGTVLFEHVLVRIDSSGNVLWARSLLKGRYAGRVLRWPGPPEHFLVIVEGLRTPANYARVVTELTRFGADGTLLDNKQLDIGGVGRIFDAATGPNGFTLVGDQGATITALQWLTYDPTAEIEILNASGLIVDLNPLLTTCFCQVYEAPGDGSQGSSLHSVLPHSNGLIVAGVAEYSGQPMKVFVARVYKLAPSVSESTACVLPLDIPQTRPVAISTFGDAFFVLLRRRKDARAAESQVMRLGSQLVPYMPIGFHFTGESQLSDLRILGNTIWMPGALRESSSGAAMILSVDASFECCRTISLDSPARTLLQASTSGSERKLLPVNIESADLKVEAIDAPVRIGSACGTVAVGLSEPRLVQSPYLNLQAAGSDGTDASRGILLRWMFDGALGKHLPKGWMAQNTLGFNNPDDFVTIYRAEWPANNAARTLNFASDRPHHVDDTAQAWYFLTGAASDLFAVQFLDAAAYATARQTADPATNPAGFLAAYGAHPFEVELRNVLAIACDLTYPANAGAALRVETRSVGENRPLADKQVTARRILGAADGPVTRLFADNMRSVRLQASATQLQSVSFICYDDVLTDVNSRSAWTPVGRFALSLDQTEVFRRLEEPARFTVNGLWRKYDATAPVKVANYQTRWSDPVTGLAAAVQSYVQLSETDPTATAQLAGALPEDAAISVSYLDLLQIVATDYHVARMLGLGHIDDAVQPATSYIHLAEYRTLGDLEDGHGPRAMQHLYLSLPMALDRQRLPLVPDLGAIEYGLTVPTGSGVLYALTDPQGYTPDGTARFIKFYPGCGPLYEPEQGFFDPPDIFDLSDVSLPVAYAVEYRGQGESTWRKPVIAHDDDSSDAASPPQPEVLTTPFPAMRRASGFIHKETEAGIHEYALRGVNLFSRGSPLGPAFATDVTAFVRRNTLLPPNDLQVQAIQAESTPVLTTANEQIMLTNLVQSAPDATLVRLCFNYGMAQETAYDFADTVEIFHRRRVPGNVMGGVAALGPAGDPALLRIETTTYSFDSTHQTVQPTLPATMKANFVGGVLVAGGARLPIEDIQWPDPNSDDNPTFVVRLPTTTGVVSGTGGNTMTIDAAPPDLHPADLVMAIENMAAAANWGTDCPLGTTIQIGDATWTNRTESFVRGDGTVVARALRGAWDTAQIEATVIPPQLDPITGLPLPPDPNPPKLYDIAFDNYILTPHPQAQAADPVNWWKGTVRVAVAGRDPEDRRNLIVIQIQTLAPNKLVLRALDDSGETDNVLTGGQLVNYYPGYKVYLHADGAHAFDKVNLAPSDGEGSRTTLLGLRARDSSTFDGANRPYRSVVGVPQLLTQIEIRQPKTPQKPQGLKYAPPPDAYGKSGYTLTVDFDNEPFSVAFYRADALSILDALYDGNGANSTLAAIRAAIFPPQDDLFFTERFEDLFAFLQDGRAAPAAFPEPGGFALPVPDEPNLNLPPGPLTAAGKENILAAMLGAFVPLTEQPLIYKLISNDPNFAPTNRPQKFRGDNGSLLMPDDPAFDLSPMAKRTAAQTLQFVDFTLDGSMNPNTVYFYFAREIGNSMQFSKPSEIFGPVKLVNLTAPAPPKLRRLVTLPFDPASDAGPRVEFEVIAPSAIDPMARLRIYRAASAGDALSIRTMVALPDIVLSTLTQTTDGTLIVADDFASDLFVPYGEPLFYRLTFIREVKYKDALDADQQVDVVSEPTRTFLANVIDVVNPPPPVPVFTVLSSASNGDKLLRATWTKTVHNGTYYLSRLSALGNWTRIGTLKTNDLSPVFDLPDPLPVTDADANPIYYRFAIDVKGSGGLLNTYSSPVTVRLDLLA